MKKVYHSLAVMILIVLVVLGLNTSNQATSSLSGKTEKPLIGYSVEKESVHIFAAGEHYSYSRQELSEEKTTALTNAKQLFYSFVNYMKKIWTIFRVIFLT